MGCGVSSNTAFLCPPPDIPSAPALVPAIVFCHPVVQIVPLTVPFLDLDTRIALSRTGRALRETIFHIFPALRAVIARHLAVNVMLLNNSLLTIHIDRCNTVHDLKVALQKRLQLPSWQQRLVHQGVSVECGGSVDRLGVPPSRLCPDGYPAFGRNEYVRLVRNWRAVPSRVECERCTMMYNIHSELSL